MFLGRRRGGMPHPESPDGTPAHTKQADWRQPAIIAGFGPRDKVQTGGNGDNRESPLPFSVISVSSCSKSAIRNGEDEPRMDTDGHGWDAFLVIRVHPRSSAVQIRNPQSAIRNRQSGTKIFGGNGRRDGAWLNEGENLCWT